MTELRICDTALKNGGRKQKNPLTFKEKIEAAKLLDRLNADVIEIDGIQGGRAEVLRVKSISSAVKHACIAVPVAPDGSDAEAVIAALSEAPAYRLQVVLPVSSVQMEYVSHRKPEQLLAEAAAAVQKCAALHRDVEFVALDATRADREYLYRVLSAVLMAGAAQVTLLDSAGTMLPEEFRAFIREIRKQVPELKKADLGIGCSNEIHMAVPCALSAIPCGVKEIKVQSFGEDGISLGMLAKTLQAKADSLGASLGIRMTELNRVLERIGSMACAAKSSGSPFEDGVKETEKESYLSIHDSEEALAGEIRRLGYDLSDEDGMKVYEAFRRVASKKEKVSTKELEVLIASEAMQVPESYRLESYMVTSGNQIEATAHIKLFHKGSSVDGISLGDGPIDAAFLAIEKITGCHYELDDFQIQAITEGREALGQTIVRLRSGGRLFSGRGTSTDIIGSAVKAYINALNKIVYEEERA